MKKKKQQAGKFKAGFIAVIGSPNVGKSTLINALVGQQVTVVSPRPQTTRHKQLGILSRDDAQLVFIDTPGLHAPRNMLGNCMNLIARETIKEADVILWVVDISHPLSDEDYFIFSQLKNIKFKAKLILALNKNDLLACNISEVASQYQDLYPVSAFVAISALYKDGLDELLKMLINYLPESEAYYPTDQVTDLYERDISADFIRAAALILLRDEVPHSLAVQINEYSERESGLVYIRATLYAEKDSQKGIIIGHQGSMLKKIGSLARQSIEEMIEQQVYLDLHVTVLKNWRNNPSLLSKMGYKIKKV